MDTVKTIDIAAQLKNTRAFTARITDCLTPEDCMIQSMEDASPVRWHLAHTTWFFETFILKQDAGYREFNEHFSYLFNSYYNAVGEQFPRPQRGTISRPGLDEIREYRKYVDRELGERLESPEFVKRWFRILEVGIHHEQQHQELILTDIKHAFSANPLLPCYSQSPFAPSELAAEDWIEISAGNYSIGHAAEEFCFDNELPRHQVFIPNVSVSKNLVTCGEFIEFMEAEGYEQPGNWLSLGWSTVQEQGWNAPLYWTRKDGQWMQFTFAGLVPVNPDWPVTHISYFEADAFARWKKCRLPTEFEWEVAYGMSEQDSALEQPTGQFADQLIADELAIHPTQSSGGLAGGVWQWTGSSYQAYPGYSAPPGAIGEYNGKFMCNQYVLRGGSVATSSTHFRKSYRNFFPAQSRWQFAGLRIARDDVDQG